MTHGHTLTVEEYPGTVRARHHGEVYAESVRALVLHETGCPDRYYLPPEDVRTERLTPSPTHTFCPFKGTASYWSLPGEGGTDQVWAYPEPLPEVDAIRGRFCFYEVETA